MHGLSISVLMTGQATEALVHGHLGRLCRRRRWVERIVPLHFLFFFCRVSRERNTDRQEKSRDDTPKGGPRSLGADAFGLLAKMLPAVACRNQMTDCVECS